MARARGGDGGADDARASGAPRRGAPENGPPQNSEPESRAPEGVPGRRPAGRASEDDPPGRRPSADAAPPKSFGNMGEHHWSVARAGENQEALDYYRERSRAPGVAAGGAERNYYCMECEGVIPYDHAGSRCPHCSAELAGGAKRYFNWVEINEPAASDLRALLPFVIAGLVVLVLALVLAVRAFR